jgi:hypothetical protein
VEYLFPKDDLAQSSVLVRHVKRPDGKVIRLEQHFQRGAEGVEEDHMADPLDEENPGFEMLVQRWHHLEWRVFPDLKGNVAPKRVNMLMGCAALTPGNIAKLKALGYGNALFIGDSDRASGYMSNIYAAQNLEAMAFETKMHNLKDFYKKSISTVDKDGIVIPTDAFIHFKEVYEKMNLNLAELKRVLKIPGIFNTQSLPAIMGGVNLPKGVTTHEPLKVGDVIGVTKSLVSKVESAVGMSKPLLGEDVEVKVTQQDLDYLSAITADPLRQREILYTIYLETGRGNSQNALKEWVPEWLYNVSSVGPAQIRPKVIKTEFLAYLKANKQRLEKSAGLTETQKLFKQTSISDTDLENYFKTREGAMVGVDFMYHNIDLQLEQAFIASHGTQYLQNREKFQNSAAWQSIKYSLYQSNLNSHLTLGLQSRLVKLAAEHKLALPTLKEAPLHLPTMKDVKSVVRKKAFSDPYLNGEKSPWMLELAKKYLEEQGYGVAANLETNFKKKQISEVDLQDFLELKNINAFYQSPLLALFYPKPGQYGYFVDGKEYSKIYGRGENMMEMLQKVGE